MSNNDNFKSDLNKRKTKVKAKILIIDDEKVNAAILKKVLEQYYTDIRIAENGEIGKNIAYEIHPDLIISDIQMPNLSGLELTDILKNDERTKNIPIILYSAFSKYLDEVKKSPCDDYISKPISLEKLLSKIKAFIG